VLAAEKHPVLHAEFGRTDRTFGLVVVELDASVLETRRKMRPLVAGVAQRLAQSALGQDAAAMLLEGLLYAWHLFGHHFVASFW
jgi:hypothetical protein